MEGDLEKVVRLLAERRWPFRMHVTYNETITRALNVFEKVNREIPFSDLHWFFDHAETITDQNIDRIRALNGGISVQHRMAYQGEFFRDRYGPEMTASSPPLRRMLEAGIPLAAGTDATRVASYNPWICLYWLVTGKTVAGMPMYETDNRLDRHEALRLWTANAAWFSNDAEGKGMIREGSLADFVVPSADYFTVPEDDIRNLYSHLTVLGGQVVYADSDFCRLGPRDIPVEPSWSPLHIADGYHMAKAVRSVIGPAGGCGCACGPHAALPAGAIEFGPEANFWDSLACPCWI